MQKLAYVLTLAVVSFPVFASNGLSEVKAAQGRPLGSGLMCTTCDPDGGGGGGSGGGSGSSTPEQLTYFEVNPASDTIEMRTNLGVVITIDEPLNKMFLDTTKFHSEKNLSDVLLRKAGGDIVAANNMRAQIRAALADAKRAAKLVPRSSGSGSTGLIAEDQSLSRSLRRHASGRDRQGLMMGGSSTYWGCYYNIYGCYVTPVSEFSGSGWGYYDFGYYTNLPDGSGTMTSDYNLWRMWVEAQCDAAQSNALATVAGLITMVGTCEFSMTGVGAWACYTGYVGASAGATNFSKNAADCYSEYPGPNNWGL